MQSALFIAPLGAGLLLTALVLPRPGQDPDPRFLYDAEDELIEAELLGDESSYDPSVATRGDELWRTWLRLDPELEPDPERKDGLELESHLLGKRHHWELGTGPFPRLARPTLSPSPGKPVWLSFEWMNSELDDWILTARRLDPHAPEGMREFVLEIPQTQQVQHAACAAPDGALWIAAQVSRSAAYDIAVTRVPAGSSEVPGWEVISDCPRGDWAPGIAVAPDGAVCVVWDSFDGESFDVRARWHTEDGWGPISTVAGTPAFEGRAKVAIDTAGRAWVAWEEGASNWGAPYTGNVDVWNNITDVRGPLHRFRRLHLARLERDGSVAHLATPLPQPSFARAASREPLREGSAAVGVYYERPELVVDGLDRPWLVYRHFYQPQLAAPEACKHHVENGWQLYARHLEGAGWSKLYRFDIDQRDGTQRLSVAPAPEGLVAIWSTGRTDRRSDPRPRGLAMARLERPGEPPTPELLSAVHAPGDEAVGPRPARPSRVVGGKTYTLVFGDLHRHTDLSLCFPFYDGSLDDAYRYGHEVGELDFLGVTDHTRDIHRGDVDSLLWWRSAKEVTRHHVPGWFTAFFSYERSHRETDHNVISLRDDMLRNFPPPLPEFWAEIDDGRTFTIPHTTHNFPGIAYNGKVWDYQDDAVRPLVEIYQGFRDVSALREAQVPLGKGYRMGFIASSDHLSTSASYACAWTRGHDRESIFEALKGRRTFGATDKLALILRSGEHWMGEELEVTGELPLFVEVHGTGPLEAVELWLDGQVVRQLLDEEGAESLQLESGLELEPGDHWIFVRVLQADGNRAWSSPLFVRAR